MLMATWLAGVAAFVGGSIAKFEGSAETEAKREIIHGVIAFGGGILAAAVALVLVPMGMATLDALTLALAFVSGGVLFCILDAYLTRREGSRAQFLAMLMDFLPEAISVGAVFGESHRLGLLLAAYIGAQNLPEGFNAFRELTASGRNPRTTLTLLLAISLLGPVAAFGGYVFLGAYPELTAGLMSFAAGGILYLIFQDIAPQSRLRRHWAPSLGAVSGFAIGMVANHVIG
jgi:ZIP family zinc transporter